MASHAYRIRVRIPSLCRCGNNVVNFSTVHQCDDVVIRIFTDLVYNFDFHSKVAQSFRISFCCIKLESHVVEFSCEIRNFVAVGFSYAEQNSAGTFHVVASPYESLEDCFFACGCDAKNFTCGFHFRSKVGVNVHEFLKAEYGNLDCKIWRKSVKTCSKAHVLYAFSKHCADCKFNHRNACDF